MGFIKRWVGGAVWAVAITTCRQLAGCGGLSDVEGRATELTAAMAAIGHGNGCTTTVLLLCLLLQLCLCEQCYSGEDMSALWQERKQKPLWHNCHNVAYLYTVLCRHIAAIM